VSVSTAPPSALPATRRRRRPALRLLLTLVLVAVLAAGAAYAAVTQLRRDAPVLVTGKPSVVAAEDLPAVADAAGHDVYGIPQPAGTRLEVTVGNAGETWVRYLTGGAAAGDERADFLTVGTYPKPDAHAAALAAAEGAQSRSADLPGGGVMLWSLDRPTSVYLARPGSGLLVEVYSPDAEQAKGLVRAGAVAPLR